MRVKRFLLKFALQYYYQKSQIRITYVLFTSFPIIKLSESETKLLISKSGLFWPDSQLMFYHIHERIVLFLSIFPSIA